MNTKSIVGFLIAGSLLMVSCKKELQPQESTVNTDSTAVSPVAGQTVQPQQPTQMPQQPAQMPQPVQQPTTTAPGMNPPHGQPGHKCEIPVGAPLNSAPNTAKASQTNPAPAVMNPTTVTPTNPTAATAPGMNPPHGQPGHKCEIPVGSPLPK